MMFNMIFILGQHGSINLTVSNHKKWVSRISEEKRYNRSMYGYVKQLTSISKLCIDRMFEHWKAGEYDRLIKYQLLSQLHNT